MNSRRSISMPILLGLQGPREQSGAALVGVGGGRRVVRGAVVSKEAVAGVGIDHDLGIAVGLLEHLAELLGVVGRGARVLSAVETEEWRLDVLHDVEAGDRVWRVGGGAGRRA